MNDLPTVIVCLVIMATTFILGGVTMKKTDNYKYGQYVTIAVQECEKELPRYLKCVPVYSAKVSDEVPQ